MRSSRPAVLAKDQGATVEGRVMGRFGRLKPPDILNEFDLFKHAALTAPHHFHDLVFFGPYGVGIDRRGGKLGVPSHFCIRLRGMPAVPGLQ